MEEHDALLVDGVAIVIRCDKSGNWKNDEIEIYDPIENLTKSRIISLVNYIYEEGYIVDRRVKVQIIDKEGNARDFKK